MGGLWRWTAGCRATGQRCATARPRSPCICCGGSSVATTDRARLFVALELPARVRSQLASWRSKALGDRDDLRLVAPASLHVTLAFLGSRLLLEVPDIEAAIARAVGGKPPPRLRVAVVKPVPPRRPRLFAFDLMDVDGTA